MMSLESFWTSLEKCINEAERNGSTSLQLLVELWVLITKKKGDLSQANQAKGEIKALQNEGEAWQNDMSGKLTNDFFAAIRSSMDQQSDDENKKRYIKELVCSIEKLCLELNPIQGREVFSALIESNNGHLYWVIKWRQDADDDLNQDTKLSNSNNIPHMKSNNEGYFGTFNIVDAEEVDFAYRLDVSETDSWIKILHSPCTPKVATWHGGVDVNLKAETYTPPKELDKPFFRIKDIAINGDDTGDALKERLLNAISSIENNRSANILILPELTAPQDMQDNLERDLKQGLQRPCLDMIVAGSWHRNPHSGEEGYINSGKVLTGWGGVHELTPPEIYNDTSAIEDRYLTSTSTWQYTKIQEFSIDPTKVGLGGEHSENVWEPYQRARRVLVVGTPYRWVCVMICVDHIHRLRDLYNESSLTLADIFIVPTASPGLSRFDNEAKNWSNKDSMTVVCNACWVVPEKEQGEANTAIVYYEPLRKDVPKRYPSSTCNQPEDCETCYFVLGG